MRPVPRIQAPSLRSGTVGAAAAVLTFGAAVLVASVLLRLAVLPLLEWLATVIA